MADLSSLSYFLPIFSFLLVFVLVYALLVKTKILEGSQFVSLFISFILASFFVVNASLVDFVQFNAAWVAVFAVCLLFILVLIGFVSGDALKTVTSHKAVAWVLLGLLVVFFVISSSYIFNWAVNWTLVNDWFQTDWWGLVLLLIVAAVVAKVITKK
jgi:hypothetical protein